MMQIGFYFSYNSWCCLLVRNHFSGSLHVNMRLKETQLNTTACCVCVCGFFYQLSKKNVSVISYPIIIKDIILIAEASKSSQGHLCGA